MIPEGTRFFPIVMSELAVNKMNRPRDRILLYHDNIRESEEERKSKGKGSENPRGR